MPQTGYFFATIIRQPRTNEETIVADNTEEFGPIDEATLTEIADATGQVKDERQGVIANFVGTGLGRSRWYRPPY